MKVASIKEFLMKMYRENKIEKIRTMEKIFEDNVDLYPLFYYVKYDMKISVNEIKDWIYVKEIDMWVENNDFLINRVKRENKILEKYYKEFLILYYEETPTQYLFTVLDNDKETLSILKNTSMLNQEYKTIKEKIYCPSNLKDGEDDYIEVITYIVNKETKEDELVDRILRLNYSVKKINNKITIYKYGNKVLTINHKNITIYDYKLFSKELYNLIFDYLHNQL